MCADQSELEGKGDKCIEADAKAIAYELDPQAVVDRAVRAERERTVTIRPAPDNMTHVTLLLPMVQGVSVYASLKRAADTTFDGRGRGQVMADTAYERITGQPADVPTPIAVNLVLTDETLLGGATTPAHVPGYGPVPAAIACRLAGDAIADERSKATLRRLYRHPSPALWSPWNRGRGCSPLVWRGSSRSGTTPVEPRIATPRSGTPTTPHPTRTAVPPPPPTASARARPATTPRKHPGWRVHTIEAEGQRHTAEYVTPTGAHHESHAPPLLNDVVVFKPSAVEARLAHHLAGLAAA